MSLFADYAIWKTEGALQIRTTISRSHTVCNVQGVQLSHMTGLTNAIENPKAERIRRAADLNSRRGRDKSGKFLIEGPQSVREAVEYRPEVIQDIYVQVASTDAGDPLKAMTPTSRRIVESALEYEGEIYVHPVTAEVMQRLSKDAQGIAAVAGIGAMREAFEPTQELHNVAAFWQVRDPGNAGAVIRAADAAGCDAVIFVDECVEVFNPKVIRSTAGSLFHLPVLHMGTEEFFAWAQQHGISIVAADVYGTADRKPRLLPDVLTDERYLNQSKAVLFGNEARGLEEDVLRRADHIVSIPIYGKAESLNLATSAAVMLISMAMSSHIGRI